MSTLVTHKITGLRAIKDHVLVTDMNFHERFTEGGIIIPGDNGTTAGIRPRWAMVVAVGPEQHDVKVGEFILVDHGRWTRGVAVEMEGKPAVIRRVDAKDILLSSDEPHTDDTFSSAQQARLDRTRTEGSMHNSHNW